VFLAALVAVVAGIVGAGVGVECDIDVAQPAAAAASATATVAGPGRAQSAERRAMDRSGLIISH